jgi:RimJ/RimL family protein N-acetyltransferase
VRVELHVGARQFLAAADSLLRSDPLSTNVVAVVAGRIATGAEPDNESYLWATVGDGKGRVLGAAMHTPPHRLFLSRMSAEAAASLACALADAGRDLPGVNGAVEATGPFAATWLVRTGRHSAVVTSMRMYQLGELAWPQAAAGAALAAVSPRDIELVAGWLAAFHQEAQPHAPVSDWLASAERRVSAGEVHVWRDEGVFVSLAAVSAPAAGVARVGPVYTPPAHRRRGYGAAVTATATAAGLNAGAERIVLYTDLANPTSNAIYQSIGYMADHDAEERVFS